MVNTPAMAHNDPTILPHTPTGLQNSIQMPSLIINIPETKETISIQIPNNT